MKLDEKNEVAESILKFFSELASKQEPLPADFHVSIEELLDFEDKDKNMIAEDTLNKKFNTISEVRARLVDTTERENAMEDAKAAASIAFSHISDGKPLDFLVDTLQGMGVKLR